MQPDTHLDADRERKKREADRMKAWRAANPEKSKASYDRSNKRRVEKDPDCYAKAYTRRYAADPQYFKDHAKQWKLKYPEKRMICAARARAKTKGIPFSITEADIVIPDTCPVLGIKLVQSTGAKTDNSPSLDRIIPDLGYVPGNVVVISLRANRIKNDATVEELGLLYAWLSAHHSKSGIH